MEKVWTRLFQIIFVWQSWEIRVLKETWTGKYMKRNVDLFLSLVLHGIVSGYILVMRWQLYSSGVWKDDWAAGEEVYSRQTEWRQTLAVLRGDDGWKFWWYWLTMKELLIVKGHWFKIWHLAGNTQVEDSILSQWIWGFSLWWRGSFLTAMRVYVRSVGAQIIIT